MTRKTWLGLAVVALIGCGGKVVEPTPDAIDSIDPPPPCCKDDIGDRINPDNDLGQRDETKDVPPPPDRTTTPPPPVDPPPPPPYQPPAPIVTPGPCHTVAIDAAGVHLAVLAFASSAGNKSVTYVADVDLDAAHASSIASLGRQGDSLFACSLGRAIRISIADGSVETAGLACDDVTADGDAIWVQSAARDALERYTDWSAVLEGKADATFGRVLAPRIGVNGSVVIGAVDGPSATTEILRFDTATGERTSSGPLSIRGPVARGVDLAADGYVYFTYASRAFGRFSVERGNFVLAGTMGDGEGFRGMVCQ